MATKEAATMLITPNLIKGSSLRNDSVVILAKDKVKITPETVATK
jgi:hypothetical protein